MALPANEVGEAGDDPLVGDQILQQQRRRPRNQQDQRHADELRPIVVQQRARRVGRDQGHDPADKDRDRRVENRHDKAGDEEGGDEVPRLPGVMPIKRPEPSRRRCPGRDGGRLQEAFEKPEDVHDFDDYPHIITARHGRLLKTYRLASGFFCRRKASHTASISRFHLIFTVHAAASAARGCAIARAAVPDHPESGLALETVRGRRAWPGLGSRRSEFRASEPDMLDRGQSRPRSEWERPINRTGCCGSLSPWCPYPARSVGDDNCLEIENGTCLMFYFLIVPNGLLQRVI